MMAYPATGNLAPYFADLSKIADEAAEGRKQAESILQEVGPALIGRRVKRFGRQWQIDHVRVGISGEIVCFGVTVNRRGKVGTRGFDLGVLRECEFLEGGSIP